MVLDDVPWMIIGDLNELTRSQEKYENIKVILPFIINL